MTKSRASQDAAGEVVFEKALMALVRLLARQAAREALFGSLVEDKDNPNDDDD